ncbi:MAG: tRNA (adenosine(37)-N6)-threonylcarbamoyltransferase complex dimerization subunit type 1 TsaB, partial [Chloroflexi bacterium]|nr:tRNA (adenosine(37)-N6)-threonylcarbamoyltransferase complex dimerization subunit type 1 TsaB [Chloroflexota bacterium]
MHILALETSGARGGIALADGADLLEETVLEEGMRHGRDLVPAAKAACERAGWNPRSIGLVAVSIGPGSFTGIRIAVTLAKVMAFDTGAKVVAVPSLRVMAENAPPDRRRVVAIVDAK